MGGEEFAILIGDASGEAALAHAEAIRERAAALLFDTASRHVSVTCSFGVAERRAGEGIDQLFGVPMPRCTKPRAAEAIAWSKPEPRSTIAMGGSRDCRTAALPAKTASRSAVSQN
jgi:GGDEF domain-containing protein